MDWDLSAQFRVRPEHSYVGYLQTDHLWHDGTEIAHAVHEDRMENEGITLKSKTVEGNQNVDGFYLGAAAGLMAVFVYGAYVSHKESKKGAVD